MSNVYNLFTGAQHGSVAVVVDEDGEIQLDLHVPWVRQESIRVVLPRDCADFIGRSLSRAYSKKVQAAKHARDAHDGKMHATLHGTSKQNLAYEVTRCTVQVVARTPFVVRLRVLGTTDWHPHKHRMNGHEFEVSVTTGEQLPRRPGRRWWAVVPAHRDRLKEGPHE